ncbi:MAG: hypothetical protein ABRQ27_00690 [Clostridiaceae bacterium]
MDVISTIAMYCVENPMTKSKFNEFNLPVIISILCSQKQKQLVNIVI